MAVKAVGDKHIRILIADASSFVRLVLSDIFSSIAEVEVVATAKTGDDVIKLIKIHRPDVLLMDLDLPQNSRNFALHRVASECPTPVLILNSKRRELSVSEKAKLNELGVYGFINKPANILKPQLRTIKEELQQKLYESWNVGSTKVKVTPGKEKLLHPVLPAPPDKAIMHVNPVKVVVMGASTGGIRQLEMFLQWLQPDFKGCILIAIHLPETFVGTFVKRLKSLTQLKVSLAWNGVLIEAGMVLVAPGGRDMLVEKAVARPGMGKLKLTDHSDSFYDSPSIDKLMESAARFYQSDTMGIILTGMGKDGTQGLSAISEKGGTTMVLYQEGSGVFGMAKSALQKGVAHYVFTLLQMVTFIEQEAMPLHGRSAGNQRSGS